MEQEKFFYNVWTLMVDEKVLIWNLGRINDAKAIYTKISNELSDPQMKQAADNALQRLEGK